ncbi:hypothetical protein OXX80_006034 [Metschnikowia pulcherrima]
MTFSLIKLVVFVAVATARRLLPQKTHTVKLYTNSAPVLFPVDQNQFLSLPQIPSLVRRGSEELNLIVPLPTEEYVWCLTGYYYPETSGAHSFTIEGDFLATIQLGQVFVYGQKFHESFTDRKYILRESPLSYTLQQDVYYPIRITYIGRRERAPINVTVNGFQQDLNPKVRTKIPVSCPITFVRSGFEVLLFVAPKRVSKKVLLSNYLGFDLVSEGFLYSSPNEIQPLTLNASRIVEITGFFQPPSDGYYNMTLADWVIAAVQIGPGMRQKFSVYTITDQWHILDNRLADEGTFLLEKHLFYPFRIVILGDKTPLEWDLTTHDPEGQPVDLLGLWHSSHG